MKNFVKWYGIIAVIVFSFNSCSNGGGGGNVDKPDTSGGGQTISGSTIVSGAPVTYAPNLPAEAKKVTDFNNWDNGLISDIINQPARVTVNSGNVTIKLGTPKDDFLNLYDLSDEIAQGFNVSDSNAKVFFEDDFIFYTYDKSYILVCFKVGAELGEENIAFLIYADRDVTIKGTHTDYGFTKNWNASLKKGWNYLVNTGNGNTTNTYTSSVSQPNGYKWTVFAVDW